MSQPLLSIIVPVYNVIQYLETSLDSLLSQTYPNIEIILIDDGSTDGSGEICDAFSRRFPQITVVHQPNRGVSAARNAGLSIARGEYIGFMDSDDWIEPEMYAALIQLMNQDGTDAAFCGYWEELESEDRSGFTQISHAPAKTGIVTREEAAYQCMIGSNLGYYIVNWNKCFKRKLLWPDGCLIPYPENIALSEDELWLSHVIQNMTSVSLTSQMFYHWRIRAGSASHRLRSDDTVRKVFDTHQQSAEQFAKVCTNSGFAMGRVYDVMFQYIWISYFTENHEMERYLRAHLAPYRKHFFKCREFSFLRKAKFLATDWMCRLHAPQNWIEKIQQSSSAK